MNLIDNKQSIYERNKNNKVKKKVRDLADIIGVNSSVCDHTQVEVKAGNQPWNKVVGIKSKFLESEAKHKQSTKKKWKCE